MWTDEGYCTRSMVMTSQCLMGHYEWEGTMLAMRHRYSSTTGPILVSMSDEVRNDIPVSILKYWQTIEMLTPQNFDLGHSDDHTRPFSLCPTKQPHRGAACGTTMPWRMFTIDIRIVANTESVTPPSRFGGIKPLSVKQCRSQARDLFRGAPVICGMRLDSQAMPASSVDKGNDWFCPGKPSERIDGNALRIIRNVLHGHEAPKRPLIIDDAVMDEIIDRLSANSINCAIIYHVVRPRFAVAERGDGAGKPIDEYGFVSHTSRLTDSPYRNQDAERRALIVERKSAVTWFPHHSYQVTVAIDQRAAFETMNRILLRARPELREADTDQMQVALRERAPKGYAACLSISVRDDGMLIRDSLHLSQYARALSDLIIADRSSNKQSIPPDSWPKAGHDDPAQCLVDKWLESNESYRTRASFVPVTCEDLENLIIFLRHELGFDVVPGLDAADDYRSQSLLECCTVSIKHRYGTSSSHIAAAFMDSFYTQDLSDLIEVMTANPQQLSQPMRQYLSMNHPGRRHIATGEPKRPKSRDADSSNDNATLFSCMDPKNIPSACWPGNPKHVLSLHQQIAVNEIIASFMRGGTQSLMGVNGPPGTGKTTLLRDVIAAIIAERAKMIARFESPLQLFKGSRFGANRKYWILNEQISGYEIIVASANNKAVENISLELPSEKAIDKYWWKVIADSFVSRTASRYGGFAFGTTATAMTPAKNSSHDVIGDGGARDNSMQWALLCAKLGRKDNQGKFFDAFDKQFVDGILNQVDTTVDWNKAKDNFLKALQREESIRQTRQHEYKCRKREIRAEIGIDRVRGLMNQRHQELVEALRQKYYLRSEIIRASRQLDDARRRRDVSGQMLSYAQYELQYHGADRERLLTQRPSWFHIRQRVEWKRRLSNINQHLTVARQQYERQQYEYRYCCESAVNTLEYLLSGLRRQLESTSRVIKSLEDEIHNLEAQNLAMERALDKRIGDMLSSYGTPFRAPYIDREWNDARTRVFLEALALHQATIAANHKRIWTNLHGIGNVVSNRNGDLPVDLIMQAWRTLFLVVPVISTTFASVSRMFGSFRDGICDSDDRRFGLALIDEAGQAQPQYAAGLLQRVRYCVAVGDPAQLEPVDTVPPQVRRLMTGAFHIQHIPRVSSNVQECVDYQTPLGQTPGTAADGNWIGIPLIVHRRCHNPMFSICNDMAYGGRMRSAVSGSTAATSDMNPATRLPASCWYDVRGESSSTSPRVAGATKNQWRPAEGERLRRLLGKLLGDRTTPSEDSIDPQDILVISPFKAVAVNIRDIYRDVVAQLVGEEHADKLAANHSGTVHISQGRESDVVILVLGSQPGEAGAGSRRWVNSKPNLLNVAVSRAKWRLYVIGNVRDWTEGVDMRYSRQLGAGLGARVDAMLEISR